MGNLFCVLLKLYVAFLLVVVLRPYRTASYEGEEYDQSAIGDPGMRRDGLRVAIEAWNQCNEAHEEAPQMGSPRHADCFDLSIYNSSTSHGNSLNWCVC